MTFSENNHGVCILYVQSIFEVNSRWSAMNNSASFTNIELKCHLVGAECHL